VIDETHSSLIAFKHFVCKSINNKIFVYASFR